MVRPKSSWQAMISWGRVTVHRLEGLCFGRTAVCPNLIECKGFGLKRQVINQPNSSWQRTPTRYLDVIFLWLTSQWWRLLLWKLKLRRLINTAGLKNCFKRADKPRSCGFSAEMLQCNIKHCNAVWCGRNWVRSDARFGPIWLQNLINAPWQ